MSRKSNSGKSNINKSNVNSSALADTVLDIAGLTLGITTVTAALMYKKGKGCMEKLYNKLVEAEQREEEQREQKCKEAPEHTKCKCKKHKGESENERECECESERISIDESTYHCSSSIDDVTCYEGMECKGKEASIHSECGENLEDEDPKKAFTKTDREYLANYQSGDIKVRFFTGEEAICCATVLVKSGNIPQVGDRILLAEMLEEDEKNKDYGWIYSKDGIKVNVFDSSAIIVKRREFSYSGVPVNNEMSTTFPCINYMSKKNNLVGLCFSVDIVLGIDEELLKCEEGIEEEEEAYNNVVSHGVSHRISCAELSKDIFKNKLKYNFDEELEDWEPREYTDSDGETIIL